MRGRWRPPATLKENCTSSIAATTNIVIDDTRSCRSTKVVEVINRRRPPAAVLWPKRHPKRRLQTRAHPRQHGHGPTASIYYISVITTAAIYLANPLVSFYFRPTMYERSVQVQALTTDHFALAPTQNCGPRTCESRATETLKVGPKKARQPRVRQPTAQEQSLYVRPGTPFPSTSVSLQATGVEAGPGEGLKFRETDPGTSAARGKGIENTDRKTKATEATDPQVANLKIADPQTIRRSASGPKATVSREADLGAAVPKTPEQETASPETTNLEVGLETIDIVPHETLYPPSIDGCHNILRNEAAELLDGFLRRLARRDARCRLILGRLGARLLRIRGYQHLGFARLSDYSRERLGLSSRSVQEFTRVASALPALPKIAAAFKSGEITWTHLRLLVKVFPNETKKASNGGTVPRGERYTSEHDVSSGMSSGVSSGVSSGLSSGVSPDTSSGVFHGASPGAFPGMSSGVSSGDGCLSVGHEDKPFNACWDQKNVFDEESAEDRWLTVAKRLTVRKLDQLVSSFIAENQERRMRPTTVSEADRNVSGNPACSDDAYRMDPPDDGVSPGLACDTVPSSSGTFPGHAYSTVPSNGSTFPGLACDAAPSSSGTFPGHACSTVPYNGDLSLGLARGHLNGAADAVLAHAGTDSAGNTKAMLEKLSNSRTAGFPLPATPHGEAGDHLMIDGEPRTPFIISCPRRVRRLWREATEFASRMSGSPLSQWEVAETIAAEALSAAVRSKDPGPGNEPQASNHAYPIAASRDRVPQPSDFAAHCFRYDPHSNAHSSPRFDPHFDPLFEVFADKPANELLGFLSSDAGKRAMIEAERGNDIDAFDSPTHYLGNDRGFSWLDRSPTDQALPDDLERLHTQTELTGTSIAAKLDSQSLDNPSTAAELDAAMRRVRTAMQRIDYQMGALLRTFFDLRLHCELGFSSSGAYARGRMGISSSKARALVALERKAWNSHEELTQAYRSGKITTLKALSLLPVMSKVHGKAWVERAGEVTLQRLIHEVEWTLNRMDEYNSSSEMPPPEPRSDLDDRIDLERLVRGTTDSKAVRGHANANTFISQMAATGAFFAKCQMRAPCDDYGEAKAWQHSAGTWNDGECGSGECVAGAWGDGACGSGKCGASTWSTGKCACGKYIASMQGTVECTCNVHGSGGTQQCRAGAHEDRFAPTSNGGWNPQSPIPPNSPWIRPVRISFQGPASVVCLLNDAIDTYHAAYCSSSAPRYEGLERILIHVLIEWRSQPRHRNPVFERDGWYCAVPACSSRRNLQEHHIEYRAHGGSNERENRISICAWHHLRGIHDNRIRAKGRAPGDVFWELGLDGYGNALMKLHGDSYFEPSAQGQA